MREAPLCGADAVRRALTRATREGASAADAVLHEIDALEARVRDREIDFVKHSRERTLSIRAFVRDGDGMRAASTSTSDLEPAAIDRSAQEAVALARATAVDPWAGLPDDGFAAGTEDLDLLDPLDREVSVEARIEEARAAEAAARASDPRIVNSEGSQVSAEFGRVAYGNSVGFLGEYPWALHSLFSEPLARSNGGMQRDYWVTAGRRRSDLEDANAVGRRAAERALRRLGARRVPTCEAPVVFEPLVARSLVGHLAACLNGGAVARDASYLAGRLGERIANERITVIDEGQRRGGLGSRPFDAEGLPTRRTVLVDRGRLESYLLDSYTARRLGLRSTGNAGWGSGGATSPAPTNLWLEPGEDSLEEIVARTPRGLLVTELIGMGFNPVTGDYSRGAAGLWIEDGRIAHPVEEITIAGRLDEMLASIDCVGRDLTWIGPVAAPSLRIASMTIAGE